MKRMFKYILLGLMVVMISLSVQASTLAGVVVASRGETSTSEGSLSQGDSVVAGDVIVTSDKSFVVIQFSDGSKVTVRPNSTVKIEEYSYSGDDGDVAELNLIEGGLRIITGAMTKTNPESYTLNTPVALMGVRGTEFAVMLCEDEICENVDASIKNDENNSENDF